MEPMAPKLENILANAKMFDKSDIAESIVFFTSRDLKTAIVATLRRFSRKFDVHLSFDRFQGYPLFINRVVKRMRN